MNETLGEHEAIVVETETLNSQQGEAADDGDRRSAPPSVRIAVRSSFASRLIPSAEGSDLPAGDLQKPGRDGRDLIYCGVGRREDRLARQVGMFDVEERLAGLSRKGDDLEQLAAVVDFELFRPEFERAVPRADRSEGGRPRFDHVPMFKVLILQTQ